jgi:hypothetical protein
MTTDLFRIAMSRDVDRSRYLAALLKARDRALKDDVPKCLRPANKQADQNGMKGMMPRHLSRQNK